MKALVTVCLCLLACAVLVFFYALCVVSSRESRWAEQAEEERKKGERDEK